MIDRDKLHHVDHAEVCHRALHILDSLSDHDAEVHGAALAVTLLAYCRRQGMDPGDFFTVGNNILHSKHIGTPLWWALHAYLENET